MLRGEPGSFRPEDHMGNNQQESTGTDEPQNEEATAETVKDSEEPSSPEKESMPEKRTFWTDGYTYFPMEVIVKDGKVTEVVSDIEAESHTRGDMVLDDLKLFKLAGIDCGAEGWRDDHDEPTEIYIKKDDINEAINNGKLIIVADEKGDLSIPLEDTGGGLQRIAKDRT